MKNDLEEEFKIAIKSANEKLEEHLKCAESSLNEAIKISEDAGIPFDYKFGTYFPATFYSKFVIPAKNNEDDEESDFYDAKDKLGDILDICLPIEDYLSYGGGWVSSSDYCS